MGLDMFALTAPADSLTATVDFSLHNAGSTELHSWRKHPKLDGWMEQLYREKGGCSEIFNCNAVALTLVDLAALEEAINTDALPSADGFFVGESDGSEVEGDLEFIAEARAAIAAGLVVYYYCSW